MRVGLLLFLGALLAGALDPMTAAAKCGPRVPFVSAPDGATLPENPVVYLFDGKGFPAPVVRVTDDRGRQVPTRIASAPSATDLRAFAIHIAAKGNGAITLDLGYEPGDDFSRRRFAYRIEPAWKQPPRTPPTVERVESEAYFWTCSHQSTWNLTLSRPAAAYRVEWSETEDAWRAGRRNHVVLPYHMDVFRYEAPWIRGRQAWPDKGRIELGHVDCLGSTLIWPTGGVLPTTLYVGVAALYADGSNTVTADEPTELKRPPRALLPRGATVVVTAVTNALGVAGLVVVALIAWRFRSRRNRRASLAT